MKQLNLPSIAKGIFFYIIVKLLLLNLVLGIYIIYGLWNQGLWWAFTHVKD